MKKILFIMSSLAGGGAEKVLITMLQHFDYTQFDVELCLITGTGVYMDAIPSQVKLTVLYKHPASIPAKLEYNSYSKLGVTMLERRRIRCHTKKNYDAIISFCEGRSLKFHSYVADRTINNISWVHCDLLTSHYTTGAGFYPKHEIEAYSAMQRIVFVSNDARSQFEKLFPLLDKEKNCVVLNTINYSFISEFRKEIKRSNDIFSIVCVGRLTPPKKFDRVIRLASRLKQDGILFRINILGEGELRKELENLITGHDVNDVVSLLGFVNPPYSEMATADLFLSTSGWEGLPLVQLEAMCLGVPVVATNCTGPREILGNSEYGLLVEQDDEAIYRGVKRMLENSELRRHYSQKGTERVKDFCPDTIMKQVFALIAK